MFVKQVREKKNATGVHGSTTVKDSIVGGVLLEMDDHLMGGSGLAHHLSIERIRGKIKFGKWHRLMKDEASSFGARHVTQENRLEILGGHDEKKQRL